MFVIKIKAYYLAPVQISIIHFTFRALRFIINKKGGIKMKETEITVQVFEDKESIFEKLKNLGFKIERTFELNDWYYIKDSDISGKSYKELLSKSIVLRQIISDSSKNLICYKNKQYNEKGDVISEEKTQVKVDDIELTKRIFDLAGLNNYCSVFNFSYVFKKQSTELALQIIKDLGIFIEYEEDDSMPQNLTPQEKIAYMSDIVKSFGLKIGDNYSCKKVEMILNKNN